MGAFARDDALRRLQDTDFDVVIIGGGITGAGCLLDAASRGLRAALIECDDFASGTSSRSSKLVHGGLRYLRQGEIGLVYEALAERQRLLNNAPHLVKPLPFILPVLKKGGGAVPRGLAPALNLAMWVYDLTGGLRIGRRHHQLDRRTTLEHISSLDANRIRKSFLYWDAQTDDARLTLAVIRTACIHFGAVAANRVSARSITNNRSGRIDGVLVEVSNGLGNPTGSFTIRTQTVVNASGVWADDVERLFDSSNARTLQPAKGVHITVPRERVCNDAAVIFQVRQDSRWIFMIPWGNFCFLGTTDTQYSGPLDDPRCTEADVNYLLDAVNAASGTDLTIADVTGSWAGLRPLVANTDTRDPRLPPRSTSDLSRRHRVHADPRGIVTVTGGKLTTYRKMAADTIDLLIKTSPVFNGNCRALRRSHTAKLPIIGSCTREDHQSANSDPNRAHLLTRFGSEITTIENMISRDPSLGVPFVDGLPYLRAELLFSARYEMAVTLDDLLTRRTRARILNRDATAACADEVARIVAPALGWDRPEQARQVDAFRKLIARDFVGRPRVAA